MSIEKIGSPLFQNSLVKEVEIREINPSFTQLHKKIPVPSSSLEKIDLDKKITFIPELPNQPFKEKIAVCIFAGGLLGGAMGLGTLNSQMSAMEAMKTMGLSIAIGAACGAVGSVIQYSPDTQSFNS